MICKQLYNVHICVIRGLLEKKVYKMRTKIKTVREQRLSELYSDIIDALIPICNQGEGVITVQPTPRELL